MKLRFNFKNWFQFAILLFVCFVKPAQAQTGMFSLSLDNDILNLVNQTDRYYTNGIQLGFYHPKLNNSVINFILLGGGRSTIQSTGISFTQKIYTPINLRTSDLQDFDRPYAAVAYLSQERITVHPKLNYRLKSELNIGVIGKYAGGELFQNFVHGLTENSDNVNGWDHQIKNDLILNYNATIEKGLINLPFLQLNLFGTAKIGTLQTSFSGKSQIAIGILDPSFETIYGRSFSRPFTLKIFAEIEYGYVFFDATLEGGVIRKTNEYIIDYDLVSRNRRIGSLGIQFCFNKVMLEAGRVASSPEFLGSQNHAWGYVKLGVFL